MCTVYAWFSDISDVSVCCSRQRRQQRLTEQKVLLPGFICSSFFVQRIPAGWPKKLAHFVVSLHHQILTNFQVFFHCHNQKNFGGINNVTKDYITPQVCRYTTSWNASVLKATTENKTTSVTTHFKSVSFSSKVDTLYIWCKTAGCDSYFRQ